MGMSLGETDRVYRGVPGPRLPGRRLHRYDEPHELRADVTAPMALFVCVLATALVGAGRTARRGLIGRPTDIDTDGISSAGQIVGNFADACGTWHGFVAAGP